MARTNRQERRFIGTCAQHNKKMWSSKKEAKQAARANHPGEHLNVYECDQHPSTWHYGHLHTLVITRGIDMGLRGRY